MIIIAIYLERYRSGHNEAVLKTVCPKGRVGSNPTLSVLRGKLERASPFVFAWATSQNPGLPETLAAAYNSGMCLLALPVILASFLLAFYWQEQPGDWTAKEKCGIRV